MVDIEYLEYKKAEIVADHIRRCGLTELDEAEKWMIQEIDWQIEFIKEQKNELFVPKM